ncbi:unnamed protein product [Arabidopsis lyrata]|uniref:GRF-type domain-containing protein n=1 Tax=Arabidopsis lyrata subsp. lyrata TaxID=81972 RepID=D7KYR9_ARALL|nr:hypothetical protein ARALYDRAFT_893792 [Arabidopsis lyrata subsp. lyrata]CAH8256850.1 unnamed protein product [Arabidopsis lyrata]
MSSSSSSRSVDRPSVGQNDSERGIPKKCYCGAPPILRNSLGRDYPGRRFYTCEMAEDGGVHIGKWWDEAMMEEATMLRLEMEDEIERMRRSKMEKMREKIQTHKEEIEVLFELHANHLSAVALLKEEIAMKSDGTAVALLKEEVAKKSDGIAVELRNVFVGAVLVLGLLIYVLK